MVFLNPFYAKFFTFSVHYLSGQWKGHKWLRNISLQIVLQHCSAGHLGTIDLGIICCYILFE